MKLDRQKQLRTIAVEHYFTSLSRAPWSYHDWIEARLDACDRCLHEAHLDKDVVDLYNLLVKVTEPDHAIAKAAWAYWAARLAFCATADANTGGCREGDDGPLALAEDAAHTALLAVLKANP